MPFTKIKQLENSKPYIEIQRANSDEALCFSDSGKAVWFNNPKHHGGFWCPTSLVRWFESHDAEIYGMSVMVPTWFLIKENNDINLANARLIATAPNMLDALNLIVTGFDSGRVEEVDIETARQIIVRATGTADE